ncbi:hypothetical protein AAC387_Pa02g2092 [Persea americana]
MRGLAVGVCCDSDFVSLAAHSDFVKVDGHFGYEAVGRAAVASSATVVALVDSELFANSAEVAYCLGSCYWGNPLPYGP